MNNDELDIAVFYYFLSNGLPHSLFSQCAPVILASRWTPAAQPRATATAGPITAERRVTSVLPVTTATRAAHVSRRASAMPQIPAG